MIKSICKTDRLDHEMTAALREKHDKIVLDGSDALSASASRIGVALIVTHRVKKLFAGKFLTWPDFVPL